MTCPKCQSKGFAARDVEIEATVRGERFQVAMQGLRCDKCGYQTVDGPQTGEFMKRASDAYRAKHQLLTSAEIIKMRKVKEWSQQDLASLLAVGIASIKRWEGSGIQDCAMDLLLRLHLDASFAQRRMKSVHKAQKSGQRINFTHKIETLLYSRGQVSSLAFRKNWPKGSVLPQGPNGAS